MSRFFLFLCIAAALLSCAADERVPQVHSGVIDFSHYDLEHSSALQLNGEWEFYWKQLLTPGDFGKASGEEAASAYAKVPRLWNGTTYNGKKLSGSGYATYRMTLKGLDPRAEYAIYLRDMGTAYRLWFDGRPVAQSGVVGPSKYEMRPWFSSRYQKVSARGKSEAQIVLQVSNFNDNCGGAWNPVFFGKAETVYRLFMFNKLINFLLIGMLFATGFYHLVLNYHIREDRSLLWFGLICFAICARSVVMGERFVYNFFTSTGWEFWIKIEHLSANTGMLFFLLFFNSLFPGRFPKKVVRASVALCLLIIGAIIVCPAIIHTRLVPLSQILELALALYVIMLFVSEVFRKNYYALVMIAGFLFFTACVVNDILYNYRLIESAYVTPYGLIIFIFTQSFYISKRITNSFQQNRNLLSIITGERNEFEHRVIERTSELAAANEKLKELDRIKTQFFANISHEFRTPLTLIRTPLQAVLHGTIQPERRILESMYRNSGRLLSLISTLLDFSKIENGKMKLHLKQHNLSTIIKESITVAASAAECAKLSLNSMVEDNIFAMVDRTFIEQAFYNLLSNAFKFTQENGMVSVVLQKKGGGNVCELSVSDTGIGIPADKIGAIFDRFNQVDSSTSRRYEGTGIGLAFTREIVDLHLGRIEVQSCAGKGSTFTISLNCLSELPDAAEEACEKNSTAESDNTLRISPHFSSNRGMYSKTEDESVLSGEQIAGDEDLPLILIVDDSKDLRGLLRSILQSSYRIAEAENGRQALDRLMGTEELPDLVLSDVMMPVLDGYEMTSILRKTENCEGIPVILLTAKAADENFLEGFGSGATDYIIKPFHAAELKARIKAQIELKRMRDTLEQCNRKLYRDLAEAIEQKKKPQMLTFQNIPRFEQELLDKIGLVEDFIMHNYTWALSREGIAEACGMSADYMTRSFAEIKGIKMYDYIRELRLDHAAKLLSESDMNVISVAHNAGFDNIRTFNRQFPRKFGVTPAEYRRIKSAKE